MQIGASKRALTVKFSCDKSLHGRAPFRASHWAAGHADRHSVDVDVRLRTCAFIHVVHPHAPPQVAAMSLHCAHVFPGASVFAVGRHARDPFSGLCGSDHGILRVQQLDDVTGASPASRTRCSGSCSRP